MLDVYLQQLRFFNLLFLLVLIIILAQLVKLAKTLVLLQLTLILAWMLLCTIIVRVSDFERELQLCLVLLDPRSQVYLITNDFLRRLGLPKKKANVLISCLGS